MLRNWFNISKAIGFILTIAGLVLAVWLRPGCSPCCREPAPLPTFVVAAIAFAMISVGIRSLHPQVVNAEAQAQDG